MPTDTSPFHPGELIAQRRAGALEVAASAGPFIRDHMPGQHRDFFAALPFLVLAAGDAEGRPWVSLLEGPEGFIATPDAHRLILHARLAAQDPLAGALRAGAEIGLLGIDLASRRRNRVNGVVRSTRDGYGIHVRQSFGNCPQYIHPRDWHRAEAAPEGAARVTERLDAAQIRRIEAADTVFIGSGQSSGAGLATDGYDASHRGGAPGFVRVAADGTLRIPDYAGNRFFNTIGNLVRDPHVGLCFVDFGTGGLLQLTGRARIDWTGETSHDPEARRMIVVTVDRVIDRPSALALRWSRESIARLRLRVIDKVPEGDEITSFLLADAAGGRLGRFRAGQHLPVALDVPGQPGKVRRSYSLTGAPDGGPYRIAVKRTARGLASRHLQDAVGIGDVIEASPPAGSFVLPQGCDPLVLASAGVGITPMLAMLHELAAEQPDRPVWLLHGTRTRRSHAFATELALLAARAPMLRMRFFYSAPGAEDRSEPNCDSEGRITARDLLALNLGPRARYLLCGPPGFLADLRSGLDAGGVAAEHVITETFGPSG